MESEHIASFDSNREELRSQARESIERVQRENKINFDKNRKAPFLTIEREIW